MFFPRVNNNLRPPIQRITPTSHAVTNEIEYFNMLFADDFDVSKSYNIELLHNFGFNDGEIRQLVFLLSAAIKANVDPKVINFRGIGNSLAVRNLERFIKNGRFELNIVPTGRNSTMVASFIKDGSSEKFDIPVCIISGVTRRGRYIGKYKLESVVKSTCYKGCFTET